MGITGLIPFLEKSSRVVSISQYAGCTVAIDSYCWLHKGAFSCAEKLARGDKTDQYVQYCMKYVNMLLSHNIKPIMVFDGRHLPAKAGTEKKRRENREVNRRRAAELLRQDKPNEAKTFLQRCVDVTHTMAVELMKECRSRGVDCITAPYEADAQLAYLNINNIADIVITEDSDLLLFGCIRVLFKLDLTGRGVLIERDRLHLAMNQVPGCFDFDKFRYMCILSGCDYLPSLPKIGLGKACRFIKSTKDPDIHRALTRLGSHLNMTIQVPTEYRDQFMAADAMFRHQPVYDPVRRRLVPLTPVPDGCDPPPLLAHEPLTPDQLLDLALGNLDPFTLRRVADWSPDNDKAVGVQSRGWSAKAAAPHRSIWSADYRPRVAKLPVEEKTKLPPRPDLSSAVRVVDHKLSLSKPSPKRPLIEPAEEMSLLREQFSGTPRSAQPTKRVRPSDADILDMLEGPDLTPLPDQRPSHAPTNPFAKRVTPSSGTGFNGLSKLAQLRRTQTNDSAVVQSRYFGSQVSRQDASRQNCDETQAGTLKDVSNVIEKSPKKSSMPETNQVVETTDTVARADLSGDADKEESELKSSSGKENLRENMTPKQGKTFKWKTSLTDMFGFKSKSHPSTPVVNNKFVVPSKRGENGDCVDDTHCEKDIKAPKCRRNPFAIIKVDSSLEVLNSQGSADLLSQSSCSQQDLTPESSSPECSSQESARSVMSRPRLSLGLSKPSSGSCQKTLLTMFAFKPKASIKP